MGERRVPCLLRIVIFLFFSTLDDLNQRETSHILCFSYLMGKCIESAIFSLVFSFFLSFFFVICRTHILFNVITCIIFLVAPLSVLPLILFQLFPLETILFFMCVLYQPDL